MRVQRHERMQPVRLPQRSSRPMPRRRRPGLCIPASHEVELRLLAPRLQRVTATKCHARQRGGGLPGQRLVRRPTMAAGQRGEHVAIPPDGIRVFHFTHLRNLEGIISEGLWCDAACRREGLTEVEIGSAGIRERRLHLPVGNVGAGGYVGDYVPWYFGPRSPMMFTLARNNYEFREGFDEVVYLVSSVSTIAGLGGEWIASDRNAALSLAEFTDDEDALVDHISWEVVRARYWTDYPDGADLRAAEFLVHETVPWEAVEVIATKTQGTREQVQAMLTGVDHSPPVIVRSQWYF